MGTGSHVTSPVLIKAIHLLLIVIQLHVQLVVEATTTVATKDTEQRTHIQRFKIKHWYLLARVLNVFAVVRVCVCVSSPDRAAGEENNALEFLVVKEVIEGPEVSLLTERV